MGFPGSSADKESTCNAGEPVSGRSPGEGNGSPLQYSCLENSMDRGNWQATVHGVAKSWTRLRDFHFSNMYVVCVCVCARARSQLCPPLCSLMDCNLLDSSVHEIFRQEYWCGLPLSTLGICLTQGSNQHPLCLLHCQADSLPLVQPGYMPNIRHTIPGILSPTLNPISQKKELYPTLVILFHDIFKSSNKMHIYVVSLSFFR